LDCTQISYIPQKAIADTCHKAFNITQYLRIPRVLRETIYIHSSLQSEISAPFDNKLDCILKPLFKDNSHIPGQFIND
jgi:hypothetical protein